MADDYTQQVREAEQNPASESYAKLTSRLIAQAQLKQANISTGKVLGDISFNFARLLLPAIFFILILLFFVGPGSFGILNIIANTTTLTWIGVIFGLVLLVKLGFFGALRR